MLPYDTERHAKGIFAKLVVGWAKDKGQFPSEAEAEELAVAAIRAAQDFSETAGLFALPHSGTGLPEIGKVLTFEQLVHEWQRRGLKLWEKRRRNNTLSHLQRYVFPTLAGRPAAQIAPYEILTALRGVEDAGYLPLAHLILSEIKSLYRFAIASGYAHYNPAAEIKRGLYRRRARAQPAILTPTRIGELLRALETYEGRNSTKSMLQIMPYVFVRPSELRKAEWSEIDLKASEWRIPAHRMKGKRPHIVPLSKQVKERLRRLHAATGSSRYIFPSMSRDKPIAGSHFRAILCDLGFKGEMTPSGFRSMAATQLSEHGWSANAGGGRITARRYRDMVCCGMPKSSHQDQ